MHWNLKSVLRPLTPRPTSPTDSGSTLYSATTPSTTSLSTNDQFPFPTNPSRVKKARHNNHPQYLPRPDASVRDVQYFLYTLLTSKAHECAKKYPEWVLETCMGWAGDGQQLRSCTEEQLTTLCPYQAIVNGIDSPKHRPGAFVPIPARHMIGQVIARFVAEKKSREKQIEDVHSRLEEERRRPSIAAGPYLGLESMQDLSLSRSASQASRRSRAQPILPRVGLEQQAVVGFGPVLWTEQAMPMNGAYVPASTTRPAHMFSGPYMSGALSGFSYEQIPSSSVSSQTSFAPYNDISSLRSQSSEQFPTIQQQSQQRRPNLYSGRELHHPDFDELNMTDATTINSKRPQRYAPRRPSSLRTSSTTENSQDKTICSTVPLRKGHTVEFVDSNPSPVPPSRPLGSVRRRSSLAASKLAGETIPEAINEHAESPRHNDDSQKTTRHDSGVESVPYRSSSSSSDPPAFLTNASPNSRETSLPASKLSRSNTVGLEQQHRAWSAPRSHNTLPVANQMSRCVSFNLGQDANRPSVGLPQPLFRGSNSDDPDETRGQLTNQDQEDFSRDKDLSEQYLAVEAEFQRLKKLRDEAVTRLPIPPPRPCLRKAQSDKTLYSSLDPMQGIPTGHKPWQYKPGPSQHPPKPEAKIRNPKSQLPNQTLMEGLEDSQARSSSSSRMQESQRRRYADAMAS
ncbi:hypothetical protein HBI16_041310 [Parastagonospora nodorum]|nr:hypothetical protein HBI16_041310 [Parastagonospora nodorum]